MALQSLKLHRERQQREREAADTMWQHSGHVFTTAQGRSIDPTNLSRTFAALLRKAGLRRIRFHDLRHSTATLLLEQGVELVVIKELLVHAHIGVTATVYAHVRLRLQRDAIDILSTALDGPAGHEPTATTATTRHCAEPSSADVGVNYCRHPMLKPRQDTPDGSSALRFGMAREGRHPPATPSRHMRETSETPE